MRRNAIRACAACVLTLMLLLCTAGFACADTSDSSYLIGTNDDGSVYATDTNAGFGLASFNRLQSGANKTEGDTYYGYAYALGQDWDATKDIAILASDSMVLVYVPTQAAESAGFDVTDETSLEAFESLAESLDAEISNGGKELSSYAEEGVSYVFTSETEYTDGDITYKFGVDIDGWKYATVLKAGLDNNRGITKFCDFARLCPADQMTVVTEKTWFESLQDFMADLDWRPLWVSLKTAGVAMIFIFILGLLAAWRCMNTKSRMRSLLDSVFTIPMVLPPTVCGFLLLLIFGKATGLGKWLIAHGIDLVFTWEAAVIAAVVVGFPLMYRTVLGAFEALDVNMLNAARTLGWSEGKIFRKLMLPLAWPSIAAGTVLAFARAMGEFGATLFFAGNYAGVTQTMPIAIYFSWMGGSTDVAIFWVIVVILISFLVIMFINIYSSHVQKFRSESAAHVDEDMGIELAFDDADKEELR